MAEQASNYFNPELVFELTKMMVSEFGYLKPGKELTKQLMYYEQNNWTISKIPECYRRYLTNSIRSPDIKNVYLQCFLGALMDATRNCGAVRFIESIEDVAIVDNEITIFINSEGRDMDKIGDWLFHNKRVDRSKVQLYNDKQIVLTNRKPQKV